MASLIPLIAFSLQLHSPSYYTGAQAWFPPHLPPPGVYVLVTGGDGVARWPQWEASRRNYQLFSQSDESGHRELLQTGSLQESFV